VPSTKPLDSFSYTLSSDDFLHVRHVRHVPLGTSGSRQDGLKGWVGSVYGVVDRNLGK
jgi:hypothetical protein